MAKIRHILIPTDGSAPSERAALRGVAFAKSIGARVTALHVVPVFHTFTYRAQIVLTYRTVLPRDTRAAYESVTAQCARKMLHVVQQAAAKAGVPCEAHIARSDQPFRAIIDTAEASGCDLIFMASHGRSGVAGVLLGSEAHKVLVHSGIPVLIWRDEGSVP